MLHTNTIEALEALAKAGALDHADANVLVAAAELEQALAQILRIAIDGTLDPAAASPGLKALLMRSGGANDFATLEAELARAQDAVREIFERVLPSVQS